MRFLLLYYPGNHDRLRKQGSRRIVPSFRGSVPSFSNSEKIRLHNKESGLGSVFILLGSVEMYAVENTSPRKISQCGGKEKKKRIHESNAMWNRLSLTSRSCLSCVQHSAQQQKTFQLKISQSKCIDRIPHSHQCSSLEFQRLKHSHQHQIQLRCFYPEEFPVVDFFQKKRLLTS